MTFAQFVGYLIFLLDTMVVPFIFGLAFISFLWGMVNYYFLSVGNAEKQHNAHVFMLWGILGMVLLFSVWGVVNLALSILGI
ncbi:MAG: hypothetical protein B7X04_03595 [Parcubacteria group bacterium 21-54-25]|nr:MAG: hypothetical protein B7X04_03595 [Parcubacteria group bacterium 21-54-25]HQU08070.1 hypothetical protein [Candidatus Paceibacterota bacterium]